MSKGTVLITGASGFVAAHVVRSFLENGYKVKATVRSQEKADNVAANFPKYKSELSFVIVEDIVPEGAFDEAVKGVDGVIHTASPFHTGAKDNKKDMLDPAIKGTTNVLSAIKENAPQVKRVVITSSFAAIIHMSKGNWPEHTYTEEDWCDIPWETAETSDNGGLVYTASKKFAEKAAWDFIEQEKPNFTAASICPPFIYGPLAHHVDSLDNLNTSSADIYRHMNGSTEKIEKNSFWAYVDVRDVGLAHVRAYEHATGGRFLITGGYYNYKQVVEAINKVPEVEKSKIAKDDPTIEWPEVYKCDNSKSIKELGMDYISLDQCIQDSARDLALLEKKLGGH